MKETKFYPMNLVRKRLCLLFLFVFGVGIFNAFSQSLITGTVVDMQKEPLPGVSVVVQGTTTGTVTDIDGNFSIQTKPENTLVFSYLGMKSQTQRVGASKVFNVTLEDDAHSLNETVVIGYGSAKKADLTGAIGSVSSAEILKQPSLNAVQAVQGKVSGVNITASDAPGANPSVTIRGMGTAAGGRNPLYIVDGFPVDNISSISPSDIVSMNILKDASSASIYGLRAANGVVMITTKKGESGTPKISVDSYVGVKNVLKKVEMANASEYITFFNENQATEKMYGAKNTYQLADASLQPFNTDWYDELLHTAFFNSNTVSVSGGGKSVDYFLSYNYYTEGGLLEGQSYNRSTIRNNNVYKFLNDRLKFTQTLNISFSNNSIKPSGAFNEAYRQSPLVATKYANGNYGISALNTTTGVMWAQKGDVNNATLNSIGNPLLTLNSINERTQNFTLQGGFEGEFKITDFLKANSRFGATKYYTKTRVFEDLKQRWINTNPNRTEADFISGKAEKPSESEFRNNSLKLENDDKYRWTWEGFVTFSKAFDGHNVEAVAGLSREKSNIGIFQEMKGYDVPAKKQYWSEKYFSSKYPATLDQYEYTRTALASYFARVQYNYNHKYYFTGTLRRDGSSQFHQSSKYWGTFPSFGLGWTLSEEEFMKNITFLNYLKLRGSWGKLGNQDVPYNAWKVKTTDGSGTPNYVFGNDYSQGATLGSPAKDISWEVTRETSLGFDFTMLNNRLSGGFDYYDKINTNAILKVKPILSSQYEDEYYDHVAKISNRGIEFNIGWRDQLANGLNYDVSFNFSRNKNRVKDIEQKYQGLTGGSLSDGQITKRLAIDQPLFAWWMYEANGVWQSQDEINNAIAAGDAVYGTPHAGYLKYKDQNGDGLIDDRDKIYAGTYSPTSYYGIHLGLDYKNFDFSIDGYGAGGNKIYNGLKYGRINGGENIAYDTYVNRWHGEGTSNTNPGANREAVASTYYLESGNFFRVNNITLGYTFKDVILKGSNLRAYVTAQNPFIITGYTGFSPELVGSETKASEVGMPNGTAGVELSSYPTTRSFLFGINLQF